MDDLYDNLENYNEESTIAELQSENKELKSKLDEYGDTLGKLQKEFDKLSSEYKQLEYNYSSLLKTAKAEIERKTEIITNLNLEKDKMVLTCFQNKNTGLLHRPRNSHSPRAQQNFQQGKARTNQDEKLNHFGNKKSFPNSINERKEEKNSRDSTASPHMDLRSKLLNLAHNSHLETRIKINSNSEVKENIIQLKKESDSFQARASIRNRRKSMPAIRNESNHLSDEGDDDFASATDSKCKDKTLEYKFSEKQKQIDHNYRERPRSKMSETSSLEDKRSGYHDTNPDSHKQRSSRYDQDKYEQYRSRHKSSNRYKRQSPERYHSGSREYYDPHQQHSDRHRSRGRMLESPPRDKFHQRSSRELHRNYYDRNHPYEHEQIQPRSHDKYTKRKIEHSSEEFENKRKRIDGNPRAINEDQMMEVDIKRSKVEPHKHLDQDQRIKDERPVMENPLEIQFSSCESPEYDCPDVSNQQIKEIKFTSTTNLDDPRISNDKYILKNNDDQLVLSTTIGRNVDIVPINKAAWGITPVNMPEALVNRPLEFEQPTENVKEMCIEITDPFNTSMESGEISDDDKINVQNSLKKVQKHVVEPVTELDKYKAVDNSLKTSNYKIPKLKKPKDEKQSKKQTKEIITKPAHDNIDNNKYSKNLDTAVKTMDRKKHQKDTDEPDSFRQHEVSKHDKNQLPCLGISGIHEKKYPTAKEVVEGDLEMSDDNCDDEKTEHVMKKPISGKELISSESEICNKNKEILPKSLDPKLSTEPPKDKTSTCDSKKSKTKKKSKHKESKDAHYNVSSTKKQDKEKDPKLKHMKTKFTELFDDSNSLISPEDLGLAVSTSFPHKCVPFLDNASDADNLSTVKHDAKIELVHLRNQNIENKSHTNITVTNMDLGKVSHDDGLQKSEDRSSTLDNELSDDVIKSIYQNLEPSDPEQEKDVVNTVIISTGVQAPVLIDDEKQIFAKPPSKANQDLGLHALATSTPQKTWQSEKPVDLETKQTDSVSNDNDRSDVGSVENSATLNQSESNSMDSQMMEANVPDVRIFVKRRRKISKK